MVKKLPKLFVKFAEQQCSKSEAIKPTNCYSNWRKLSFNRVFKTFKKHYVLVPLEVFKGDPYKTLISTILSSRTRDEVTLQASQRLFKVAPNIQAIKPLSHLAIEQLIFPVGFTKTKALHIKKLAGMIDVVPKTREELMKLPGVGRKTANLVLNRAFNIPAIAVDTHVHRISNLLGWVKTKTPEQTEKELTKILPRKYWKDVNILFVSIGRQYRSIKSLSKFLNELQLTNDN